MSTDLYYGFMTPADKVAKNQGLNYAYAELEK